MAAAPPGARFNAVQLGNLLFLIDREIADKVGGPHFDFAPYPHGPYDPAVHETLEALAADGKVLIDSSGPYWTFAATTGGLATGGLALDSLPRAAVKFVKNAAGWVLSASYWVLVATILRRYPDMATASCYPPAVVEELGREPGEEMHPFLRGMAQVVGILRRPGERPGWSRDPIGEAWRSTGEDLRMAMEQVSGGLRA